jgi:hypothetical protein
MKSVTTTETIRDPRQPRRFEKKTNTRFCYPVAARALSQGQMRVS